MKTQTIGPSLSYTYDVSLNKTKLINEATYDTLKISDYQS